MDKKIINELNLTTKKLEKDFDNINNRGYIINELKIQLCSIKKLCNRDTEKYKMRISIMLKDSLNNCNVKCLSKSQLFVITELIGILNQDTVNKYDFIRADDLLVENDLDWIG